MKKNLLILTLIYIFFSVIYYAKTGNFLVDFSREAYIPYQMLQGEKIIKDIFLIYGPFGYFINYLLYKVSVNINLLLILSHIIGYICTIIFYIISKHYLKEKDSLILSILFICVSVFSNSTFSFVVPYSYSTLWAYLGCYLAYYFYINQKTKNLYATLGFIAINRIELFILLFIFFSAIYLYEKKFNQIKNFLYVLIFPAITIVILFIQKIPVKSLIDNIVFIKKMISTQSVYNLYKSMGGCFQKEYIILNAFIFLLLFLILTISYILYKKNYKFTGYAIFIAALLFFNLNNIFNLSAFFIVTLLAFLKYKKLITKEDVIISIFSLLLCYKSLFKISPLGYSNFGYIFIILTIYYQLTKILDKKWVRNIFIIFTVLTAISNYKYFLIQPKFSLKYDNQKLYFNKKDAILFKKTNEYIQKNIKKNEQIIVVPEGQIFNLINKKSWNFYNSTFTPLDFETFGEKYLIEKLKKNKTDYIIFYPRNTKEYGFATICYDYGVNFCTYIMDNYKRTAIIEEDYKVLIFKINNET